MSVRIVADREGEDQVAPARGLALAKAMGWDAKVVGNAAERVLTRLGTDVLARMALRHLWPRLHGASFAWACIVGLGADFAAAQPNPDAAASPIRTDWGSRVLGFDFSAFEVGIAEYPDGPTGVTVLHFPDGAAMAMDVRGGSPGVVGDYGFVHAISLAGGSLLGLEAVSGVASGLLQRRGDAPRWDTIPLVNGGIVYDFGGRDNGVYPDKRLGRAALLDSRSRRRARDPTTLGRGPDRRVFRPPQSPTRRPAPPPPGRRR